MAYRIFLTDGIDTAEMDTENIDTKTIFALLDLQDIGSKKNDIETLTFKGTKNNNEAFGSFFDFSRESNVSFSNNLFFNYNPLKAVKTFVYEDTELIFVGDLRLTEINVDVNGVVIYNCVVATKLTLLKTALSDKFLEDLDFTDLRHRYCWPNISGWIPLPSGGTNIEIYDVVTDTYTTINAPYGTGYVYPLIDYGFRFEGTGTASYSGATISQKNLLNLNNFKAAVYLKEYLNRIFSQDVLDGFTYEVKGSANFLQQFNQVIIPETNEDVTTPLFDVNLVYEADEDPLVQTVNRVDLFTGKYYTEYISLTELFSPTPPYYFQLTNNDNFLKALRNINSSVKLKFDYSITTSNYTDATNLMFVSFRINKTSNAESYNPVNGTLNILNTIADITIPAITWASTPITVTGTSEVIIDNFSINRDEYLLLNVSYSMVNPLSSAFSVILTNSISNLTVTFPGRTGDTFNILSIPSSACTESTDIVAPKAPVNVKQLDFLKSIINQFNFVVYTEKDNYKHFIFELYDDFYAKTTPQNLITNSVDWTNKIDYTRGLQIKPNIELPKSYLYTYKSDIDVLNTRYKNKYNEIYGQFSFNDELGLVDQKKVELLFAPTPIASINNIELPLYYKVENNEVKTTKIVPRIIYYNGYDNYNNISNSNYYVAYQPIKTGSTNPSISILTPLLNYPNCSNYFYKLDDPFFIVQNVPVNDIHFNEPRELYFQNVNNIFNNQPNSYTNYYINQVTELTDENVIFVECDVYLTEFDIGNLDLSVPVYIQTGNNNGAYFKIINVEYENKDLPSKVKLQKIVI